MFHIIVCEMKLRQKVPSCAVDCEKNFKECVYAYIRSVGGCSSTYCDLTV